MISFNNGIPSSLFKYCPDNCKSVLNLVKKQIYFPKPSELNDPFDFNISFRITNSTENEKNELLEFLKNPNLDNSVLKNQYLSDGKLNKLFDNDFRDGAERIEKAKREGFQKMGVACFSSSKSNNPDNLLLWSHYTDGHKGFCLEFDPSFYPFQGQDICTLEYVRYEQDYPTISYAAIISQEIWLIPLLRKSKDWCYEAEWRIIIDNGSSIRNYENEALKGVYFGCQMEEMRRRDIYQALNNPSLNYYEMIRSKTSYTVEAIPWNNGSVIEQNEVFKQE